jgi:hypothetical protein
VDNFTNNVSARGIIFRNKIKSLKRTTCDVMEVKNIAY